MSNPPLDIEKTLKAAVAHHQAGRWVEANHLYKQVLEVDPNEPDALRLLGQLLFAAGNHAAAADLVCKAIAHRPGAVDFHIDLARISRTMGDWKQAADSFARAVQINPFDSPETRFELAQALMAVGRLDEAVAQARLVVEKTTTPDSLALLGGLLRLTGRVQESVDRLKQAVDLAPGRAELLGEYGLALQQRGDFDLAEGCFEKSLQLKPDSPEMLTCLGSLRVERRRFELALDPLRRAVALRPDLTGAHFNLALAHTALGQVDDALRAYQIVLEKNPNFVLAWEGLGRLLLEQKQYAGAAMAFARMVALHPTEKGYLMQAQAHGGLDDLDSAVAATELAVKIAPQSADAHAALGNELRWTGDLQRAIEEFRTALKLDPQHQAAHSNLVYTLLADDSLSPKEILDAHVEWDRQQTVGITPLRQAMPVRDPDRRLRIGYVSNNFRNQAVSSFVLPIVKHHDRIATEVFCYSDLEVPDDITRQYESHADQWRQVAGWSDEQLAKKIREDRIDILVELTGHIGHGRLKMLAYKPAPIQISYIGYQGTTGMSAINYVLTDEWTDPTGQAESNYIETAWRLPETFFVYQPPGDAPMVDPLPARANGFITFGCLNAVWKATEKSVRLWGKALSQVPGSKMILLTTRCKKTNTRLIEEFSQGGIAPERIQLVYRSTAGEYLRRYGRIDIALDPVPFLGHTTTCDAAWMGCPTVSLAGKIYAHRFGGSVMRNVELADLVTESEEGYIATAVSLANDLDRLGKIRSTLRFTMQDSIITDGPRFTRNLEQAYRAMWREWCARSMPG